METLPLPALKELLVEKNTMVFFFLSHLLAEMWRALSENIWLSDIKPVIQHMCNFLINSFAFWCKNKTIYNAWNLAR